MRVSVHTAAHSGMTKGSNMESIKIEGVEQFQSIYVGTIGEDVWVDIIIKNGSANLCLTSQGAEDLIDALRIAISATEYAS